MKLNHIRLIKFYFLVLALLSLSSCTSHLTEYSDINVEDGYVNIRAMISSVDDSEASVSTLRMIIFSYETGVVRYNEMVSTPAISEGKITMSAMIKKTDPIRIVLIANEPTAWNLNTAEFSYATLRKYEIDYYDGVNGILDVKMPFLMMTESGKIVMSGKDNIEENMVLTRNSVKITLNLKQDLKAFDFKDEKLLISKIYLDRLPRKSYLFPGNNCTNPSDDAHAKTVTKDLMSSDFTEDVDYSTLTNPLVFYVSEHVVRNKHKHSYIEIVGKTDKRSEVVYIIPLGDGIGKIYDKDNPLTLEELSGADLSIVRNNHYTINATIVGLGRLDASVKIAPWTEKEIDADIQTPYLNVSKTSHNLFLKRDKEGVITPSSMRVEFWSNYKSSDISLKANMQKESMATGEALVSDINLSDVFESNVVFTKTEKRSDGTYNTQGYIDLKFKNIDDIYNDYDTKSYTIFFDGKNIKRNISFKFPFRNNVYWKDIPWVGIYYKPNDTYGIFGDERIISSRNDGVWSVDVEYPSGGKTDWVLLTTTPSPDTGLGTDDALAASACLVTEGSSTVSGVGDIYFRTGLKNRHTSGVRYARLKVTTELGVSYIYLRQGNGDSNLMSGSDKIYEVNGGVPEKDRVGVTSISVADILTNLNNIDNRTIPFVFGRETAYSGMQEFWNAYNRVGKKVDVFHPFLPSLDYSITTTNSTDEWNAEGETCPTGYAHPTVSQLENSLLLYYKSDGTAVTDPGQQNYIFGYCADGVIDRRLIEKITTTDKNGAYYISYCKSVIKIKDYLSDDVYIDVSVVGMQFFNSSTYASIFFPANGYREYNSGKLIQKHMGALGLYWTKDKYDATNKRAFTFGRTAEGKNYVEFVTKPINTACGIRCVKI